MGSLHLQSQTFSNKENTNIPVAIKQQQHLHKDPTTPTSSKTFNIKDGIFKPKKLHILKETPTKSSAARDLSTNLKRVPLGGKDNNTNSYFHIKRDNSDKNNLGLGPLQSIVVSDSAKKRSRRLRTPSSIRSSTRGDTVPGAPIALNNKLKVLRDDLEGSSDAGIVNRFNEDDDIEFGPSFKEKPMLDVPHYYEPLTDEDLENFQKIGTNPRLIDLSNNDDSNAGIDVREEFELHFSDLDDDLLTEKTSIEEHEEKKPNFMKDTFVSKAKKAAANNGVNKSNEVFDEGLSIADMNSLLEL